MERDIVSYSMATLESFAGREIGVSGWVVVDQKRIDEFADCTGDRQWIHVDVERARRESPYGGTIAHGYLALSLVGSLCMDAGIVPGDASAALNYGLDKVRFLAPVKAGSRVRNRVALASVERKEGGRALIGIRNTLEIEGEAKPALVADTLAMLIP
jgi:acyl dehydratase